MSSCLVLYTFKRDMTSGPAWPGRAARFPKDFADLDGQLKTPWTSPEPMSMREFSRLIRRSPSHISRVMSGKRASLTISRLMKTLGVEVA